jgi:hypothetical protein
VNGAAMLIWCLYPARLLVVFCVVTKAIVASAYFQHAVWPVPMGTTDRHTFCMHFDSM